MNWERATRVSVAIEVSPGTGHAVLQQAVLTGEGRGGYTAVSPAWSSRPAARRRPLSWSGVSDTRSRPRTRRGASPYSCSTCRTRARRVRGADGQAERLLLAWTGLRSRHGRATEGVASGRPRVRSPPWRRLSPRPDGEDRERRRAQLVFDGRRALSCTRERDRQDWGRRPAWYAARPYWAAKLIERGTHARERTTDPGL